MGTLTSTRRSPFGRPYESWDGQLLSRHEAAIKRLIHFSLALFQEYDEGKYTPAQKVITDCGPAMLPLRNCFKIK